MGQNEGDNPELEDSGDEGNTDESENEGTTSVIWGPPDQRRTAPDSAIEP